MNKYAPKFYTLMGKTMNITQWARKYELNVHTLARRLRNGMPLQDALFKPVGERSTRIETNIGTLTINQIAKIARVSPATILTRLHRGWKVTELAAPNMKRTTITAFGKTKTTSQWARENGISRANIWHRLNDGWTPEDAVSMPLCPVGSRRSAAKLTAFGRAQSFAAWSRERGIHPSTLKHRIHIGMSPEVALTAPVAKRGFNYEHNRE